VNRRLLIWLAIAFSVVAVAAAFWLYQRDSARNEAALAANAALVRPHAPSFGPADARVTIVEFFDPACEACRAFYPYVKQILAAMPQDVRLVLRYTPFHKGSDEAVGILEAARSQERFEPVLEALLDRQHEWADHGRPDLSRAWQIAGGAGLDVERARTHAASAAVASVLKQDMADLNAMGVHKTPTFYVNGTLLTNVSPQGLLDLVKIQLERAR
jgi:protein-disulfide isomerase